MRILFPLAAAAASALAFATPASAQWVPHPQAYGQPYGYNPYGHDHGQVRALQVRIDRIQRDIRRLAQHRMISRGEYHGLRNESRQIERRLRHDLRDGRGLTRQEAFNTERRIARLEYRIARDMRDGRRWGYRW